MLWQHCLSQAGKAHLNWIDRLVKKQNLFFFLHNQSVFKSLTYLATGSAPPPKMHVFVFSSLELLSDPESLLNEDS